MGIWKYNNLKVLETGQLQVSKGDEKVTLIKRPFKLFVNVTLSKGRKGIVTVYINLNVYINLTQF